MADRKYSISEIDRMRTAIAWIFPSGDIENLLRTYMQNGTEPEELEKVLHEYVVADYKSDSIFSRHSIVDEELLSARIRRFCAEKP